MIETPDVAKITKTLADLFPEMSVEAIRIVDVGFRSIVAETNTNEILLIGRHPQAICSFEKEFNILPLIGAQLPIQIPRPNCLKMNHESFPYGMMMYEKIPGTSLNSSEITDSNIHGLAKQLADFLQDLHGIDTIPFALKECDDFCRQVRRLKSVCFSSPSTILIAS